MTRGKTSPKCNDYIFYPANVFLHPVNDRIANEFGSEHFGKKNHDEGYSNPICDNLATLHF